MKAQALNLIEKNGLSYVKTKSSKVFRPQELPVEIFKKLNPEMQKLEYAAQKVNKPIYFYPLSKDRTLMNFGPYTSVIMNDLPENELSELLSKQVERTYKSCNINR